MNLVQKSVTHPWMCDVLGLCTDDLEITYKELIKNGVEFTMTPTHQPWGGFMAMFKDPDGNTFYLDQPNVVHSGD